MLISDNEFLNVTCLQLKPCRLHVSSIVTCIFCDKFHFKCIKVNAVLMVSLLKVHYQISNSAN